MKCFSSDQRSMNIVKMERNRNRIISSLMIAAAIILCCSFLYDPAFAEDKTIRRSVIYFSSITDDYELIAYDNSGKPLKDGETATFNIKIDYPNPKVFVSNYHNTCYTSLDPDIVELRQCLDTHNSGIFTAILDIKSTGTATIKIDVPEDEEYTAATMYCVLNITDRTSGGNTGGNTGGNIGDNTGGNTGDNSGNGGSTGTGSDTTQPGNTQQSGSSDTSSSASDKTGTGTQSVTGTKTAASTTSAAKVKKSKSKKIKLKKPKLKCSKRKKRSIKLSWNKVRGATGYQLYIKYPGEKKYHRALTKDATVKSVTHRGLSKGRYYRYKLRAFRKVGGKKKYGPFSKVLKVKVK